MCNINEVHKIELMLLDKFIEVCNKHNLQWFADSGTLLGAVRNKEMIPWDDDIDVIMLREDYNKLLKIASKEFKSPFFFQNVETDNFVPSFSKLRYSNSTILEKDFYSKNNFLSTFNKGIFIDIFVLDAVPDLQDEFESLQYMLRYIYNFSPLKEYDKVNDAHHERNKQMLTDLNWLLTQNSIKHKSSKYLANLYFCKSSRYRDFVLYREDYSSYYEIDFKGLKHKLRLPIGAERILATWYGKDWKIPMKQDSKHSFENAFYDVKQSYMQYEQLSFEEYMKLFD